MKREKLEEMTRQQLLDHAEVQGVKISQPDSKETIINKIMGDVKIEVKSEAKSDLPLPQLGSLRDLQGNLIVCKTVKLTIFSTENDKGDVPIIINGHNFIVKRDVEVEIQEPYVGLLRDAIVTTVRQDPDTGRMIPQRIMNFPHQSASV